MLDELASQQKYVEIEGPDLETISKTKTLLEINSNHDPRDYQNIVAKYLQANNLQPLE
jgi:hypothetical protein